MKKMKTKLLLSGIILSSAVVSGNITMPAAHQQGDTLKSFFVSSNADARGFRTRSYSRPRSRTHTTTPKSSTSSSKSIRKTISKGLKKTRMKQQSKQLKSFSTLPKRSYVSRPYGYRNSMLFSNNWLMYFLLFNALTPHEQRSAIAANVDEDVYTITVNHNGKDRVYVVTEDVYNKVNEGTPVHIENGQVTIK